MIHAKHEACDIASDNILAAACNGAKGRVLP